MTSRFVVFNLSLIGHPVFTEYRDALADRARRHAIKELELYQQRLVTEKNAARKKLTEA
jgi:hypothetical protein